MTFKSANPDIIEPMAITAKIVASTIILSPIRTMVAQLGFCAWSEERLVKLGTLDKPLLDVNSTDSPPRAVLSPR